LIEGRDKLSVARILLLIEVLCVTVVTILLKGRLVPGSFSINNGGFGPHPFKEEKFR
jgi:hypothetical protein